MFKLDKNNIPKKEPWRKAPVYPRPHIEVHDPIADALSMLAANIGALALAIDAYVQSKKIPDSIPEVVFPAPGVYEMYPDGQWVKIRDLPQKETTNNV